MNSATPPEAIEFIKEIKGHRDIITELGWSPDGRTIASCSRDRTVAVYELESGEQLDSIGDQEATGLSALGWLPTGKSLITGSYNGTIRYWNREALKPKVLIHGKSGDGCVLSISPDGRRLASSANDVFFRLWNLKEGKKSESVSGHSKEVTCLAWTPDGQNLVSGSNDHTAIVWSSSTWKPLYTLEGHTKPIVRLAVSPDGMTLATASKDHHICIWDLNTGERKLKLEDHKEMVFGLHFSHDSILLASRALDGTILVWRTDTWEVVLSFQEELMETNLSIHMLSNLCFHPHKHLLATAGDRAIKIWDLKVKELIGFIPEKISVHYQHVRVAMIGDKQTGKSALARVLINPQFFKPNEITLCRSLWRMPLKLENKGVIKRIQEVFVEDLNDFPDDYMDNLQQIANLSTAVVVFDAQSDASFNRTLQWEKKINQVERSVGENQHAIKRLLVASKSDREGSNIRRERIEPMIKKFGYKAWIQTSAVKGWSVDKLERAIFESIDWSSFAVQKWTELFANLRQFLLEYRESDKVFSRTADIKENFLKSRGEVDHEELDMQFDKSVRQLESMGLLRRISFGDLVLFQPELIDLYISYMRKEARENSGGMGCIPEEMAKTGEFMPADLRLRNKEDEQFLLHITIESLLSKEVVLREFSNEKALLIFPSEFTREVRDTTGREGKSVIFRFEGNLHSIYARLVVRKWYSGFYTDQQMWMNSADFSSVSGGVCGIVMNETPDGKGELTVYFDHEVNEITKSTFEAYIYEHLEKRAVPGSVSYERILSCNECGNVFLQEQVKARLERKFNSITCPVCEVKVNMENFEKPVMKNLAAVTQMNMNADRAIEVESQMSTVGTAVRNSSFLDWAGKEEPDMALVFTDIVNSTEKWQLLGDQKMSALLEVHFQTARDIIKDLQGFEIKTVGDSIMVAFHDSLDAFRFVTKFHKNPGCEEFKIRAGIHYGPLKIMNNDAFGSMVNFTARIVSFPAGDQICLSDVTKKHIEKVGLMFKVTEETLQRLKGHLNNEELVSQLEVLVKHDFCNRQHFLNLLNKALKQELNEKLQETILLAAEKKQTQLKVHRHDRVALKGFPGRYTLWVLRTGSEQPKKRLTAMDVIKSHQSNGAAVTATRPPLNSAPQSVQTKTVSFWDRLTRYIDSALRK